MRFPPLELYFIKNPDWITIASENKEGKASEITIPADMIDVLIDQLMKWKDIF